MRQQVNDDRIRARQLLYISQEIIKLKVRLDEELSHFNSIDNHSHPWLDESSLTELMRRVHYEIDSEKDSRQVNIDIFLLSFKTTLISLFFSFNIEISFLSF
jgi:hypothetical protein